jgi:transcription elongation factor/antiterminator RfaH
MRGMSTNAVAAAGVTLNAEHALGDVRLSAGVSVLRPAYPHLGPTQPGQRRTVWYAVHAKPRRELQAQAQLSLQGFRTFLPRFRKTVRHARKLTTVSAPFFDRYLFVALDLDRDRWRSVNGTFGVTRLVANATGPTPLPPGVIEAMIGASDEHGFINVGHALAVGDSVRVLSGPFADLVGVLVRADGARRVQVLLQLLGGAVAVSIDRGHLAATRAA